MVIAILAAAAIQTATIREIRHELAKPVRIDPTPIRPTVLRTPQGYIAIGYPICGTEDAKKAEKCIAVQLVPCPMPDDFKVNTWTLPILPLGCSLPPQVVKP
jgi:hypothetical protein